MVAIFTGAGTGFERGSGSVLGAMGLLGAASMGRNGEQILLNAANGNLMVTQRDEFLVGRGPDAAISRTYNSHGSFGDDNGDHWRQSTQSRLYDLRGGLNAHGSNVRRYSGDGSETVYHWNGAEYVTTEGGGAHDRLSYTGGGWTWTDGEGKVTEFYEDNVFEARLKWRSDTSGNRLTYHYNGDNKVSQITTQDGSWIQYHYAGPNIAQVHTGFSDVATGGFRTQTRTRYGYDHLNRLTAVTVDLTPEDNHQGADGYTTNYGYHGESRLIAWIAQTDGSRVDFGYDGAARVTHITQTAADGVGRTTTIGYGGGFTNVTDPIGQVTTLEYNGDGSLRRIVAPPAHWGAGHQTVEFGYSGSTVPIIQGSGTAVSGNVSTKVAGDGWGNHVAYGSQIMSGYATVQFRLDDPRAGGKWQQAGLSTVANRELAGTYWADGGFAAAIYFDNVSDALMINDGVDFFRSSMTGTSDDVWSITYDGSKFQFFKNNVLFHSRAAAANLDLVFKHRAYSHGSVVRDVMQGGADNLARVTDATGGLTRYTYDHRGNVVSETDRLGNVITRTYGGRNELLTETRVGSNQATGTAHHTTRYAYDGANRLRFLVSATGAVTEYWYDGAGQLTWEAQHTDRFMDVNGLAPTTPLSEGEVLNWRNSFDKAQLKILENRYDVRGNLRERVTYGASGWHGEAQTHDGYTHEFFTYDQAGQLLTRSTATVPAGQPSPIHPSHGNFLGRFGGTDGHEAVHKTFSLNSSVSQAGFEFDFIKLDSWDAVDRDGSHGHYNEQLTVYINGAMAFRFMPHGWGQGFDGAGGTFSLGGITGKYTVSSSGVEQNLGYSHFPDRPYRIRVELDGTGSSVRLGFGSTSDQHIDDESWGIDNVRLIQPAIVDDFENGGSAGWYLNGSPAPNHPQAVAAQFGVSRFVHGLGGTGGAEALAKTYTLNPAQNRTSIDFDFLKLDSWDGESLQVFLNGGHAFNFAPEGWHHYGPGQDIAEGSFATAGMSGTYRVTSSGEDWGHRDQPYWGERVYRVHLDIDGTGHHLRLGFGTTLDEWHGNENWAIDNVRVAQPDLVDDFNNGSPMGWMVHGGGAWTTGAIASTGPVLPNRETFVYDGLGRLIASTDLNGGTTSILFRDAAQQTVVTLANGFVTTSTYDRAGELVSKTEAGDYVTGSTVLNRYDQLGRLRMTTDASGVSSYFVYDKVGRKVADVNHYGGMTEYRYDANDRLVATVRYQHWIPHHLGTLQDPNAVFDISQIRPPYHPAGHSATDIWTWQVYDREGRLIEAIDGTGGVTAFEYDASDRLVRTTSFANRLEGWQVDQFKHAAPAGPVHPPASGADKVARNFYDKDGLLIGTLDGEGYITQIIYDAAGQKVQEIALAHATPAHLRHWHSFNDIYYNTPGHPQDRSTRYVYDGQGLLRFTVNGLGQVTEYRYESGGTWTAIGQVRETIRYVGAIPPLGTYTLGSVRGALAAHGLAGHGANRVDRTVYDSAGRAAYTINAAGGVTAFSYDAMGQVTKTVQFAHILPIGHLPSQIDMDHWAVHNGSAANRVTRNYYSDRGELRFVVDAEGFITRNDYDASGRIQRTVRFANPVGVDDGATISTIDRLASGASVSNSYFYDAMGRLQRTTDGEGNHREFHYWTNGKLAWDIAMHGHAHESRTLYEYDGAGRMIAEHRAHGTDVHAVTRFGYDGHGNNTLIIDPNGNHTWRSYDKAGRMVSQTDAMGGVTSYGYNAFGEVTRVTDPRGHATYHYYDKLGRVTHVRDAEDHVTETHYNVFGEVDTVVRRYNRTWNGGNTWDLPGMHHHHLDAATRFEYDKLGRVVRTTDAEGHFEQYTLNAFGDRVQVRNKLGGVTYNEFDRRGLLLSERLPMASIHRDGWAQAWEVTNRFEYDARGNRTRMIEAAGLAEQRITSYVYDRADRLIETRHQAVQVVDQTHYHIIGDHQPVERIRYDGRGNIIETYDALGARTLFYYDKLNRKTEQVDALGNIVSWRYDRNGNLTHERRWSLKTPWADIGGHHHPSVTDQDRVTDFQYDGLNRMTASILRGARTGRWDGHNYVAWTGDHTTQYAYDAAGNLKRVIDANGGATHHYYDRLNRKIRTVDAEGYVTGWLFDAEGNAYHERRWAHRTGYADINGWHDPSGGHENDRVTDFTYDRNGRRKSERRLVNGYGWQDGDSVIYYDYNGLGQVTRKIEATHAGASHWDQHATEYHYDGAGRLTKELRSWYQSFDGNWVRPTVDYAYDGLNNLTRTRQSGDGAWQGERVTRYAYKAGGRLAHMWDANGAQFNYDQDIAGNLVVQTWDRQKADGSHVHEGVLYTRDVLGRVTSQALGTWHGYWVKGDVQNTAYNNFGEVSAKGINGWQEVLGYDRGGRLERTNQGDGVWRYFVYDAVGNQTLTIENEGDGDLVDRTTDHALYRAQYWNHHHAGNAYIDGLNVTINIYDRRNQAVETQLRQRQLNGGHVANLSVGRGYNAFGEVVVERDARGHHTHFGYNTMGRNIWIQRPTVLIRHENGHHQWVNPTERFFYDRSGRLTGVQDANGTYSSRELLNGTGYNGTEAIVLREYHADGGVIHNGYDVFGDLRRQTNEVGWTRHMNYDGMGRLSWEGHANGYHEAYHYDLLGQRTRHWDNYHGDQEWTDYDVQGRVTRHIAFGGDQTHTSYSWHGHLHTHGMGTYGGWQQVTTFANGRQMVEQSDMFGRDLYKRDLGGREFGYHYDLAGRVTHRWGGEALWYGQLNTGLVGSIHTFSGDRGSQNWSSKRTDYGYDANGNLVTEYSFDEGEQSYQYWHNDYEPDWYYNSWHRVSQNSYAEYDALNRRTHWREHGNGVSPDARVWTEYDANGNVRRTYAEYRHLDQNGAASPYVTGQEFWYRYDNMNRVVTAKGVHQNGQIVRGHQGVDYAYNQAGQRVRATRTVGAYASVYDPYAPDPWEPDPWDPYEPRLYQSTDTFDTSQGAYTSVYYEAEQREDFVYDATGSVHEVRIAQSGYSDNGDGTITVHAPPPTGELKARYWQNLIGLNYRQIDYRFNGDYNHDAAYDREVYYNGKDQAWGENVFSRQGADWITNIIRHDFAANGEYALGAVTYTHSHNYKNNDDYAAPNTDTRIYYAWYDGAVQSQIRFRPDTNSGTAFNTTFSYNGSGHLLSAQVNDGRPRTVSYTNDLTGQTIRRDESDRNYSSGDPHEVWYRFGGKQMGYVGNNGTLDTDYKTSISNRMRGPSTSTAGAFRFGASYGSAHADFDLSLKSINSYEQGGAGGSHVVRTGESLQSIAQNLWGDANLWYKLAEANGIAGGAISEGQRLTVPAGVMKNTHNAGTLKPYDPSEIIGDVNPTTPQPQKAQKKGNKCGVFGAILLVAIAVVVTIATKGAFTKFATGALKGILGAGVGAAKVASAVGGVIGAGMAGAAGSIASQGFGVATGLQDKFSWKGVALSAVGAGVGGALGGMNAFGTASSLAQFGSDVVRGALGSAITQGIGVATGLQKKFDWAGVAAAGIAAGVEGAFSRTVGGAAGEIYEGKGGEIMERAAPTIGHQAAVGMAGAIAEAASLSLLKGTSFGDNLISALPNAIGRTIGNSVANLVSGARDRQIGHLGYVVGEKDGQPIVVTGQSKSAIQKQYNLPSSPVAMIVGLSLTKAQYIQAVKGGLWKLVNGKGPMPASSNINVFQNDTDVANATAASQSEKPTSVQNVSSDPQVRQFILDIAELTRAAKLSGGQQYEKFLTVGRNSTGELIVTSIAALPQGATWTPPSGTITHLHIHHNDLYQPPHAADDAYARTRGKASFVVGGQDRNLYEVGRQNGQSAVRLIKNNGVLGTWLPYQIDPKSYYVGGDPEKGLRPQYKEW
jgi:YD repeat-containing protein